MLDRGFPLILRSINAFPLYVGYNSGVHILGLHFCRLMGLPYHFFPMQASHFMFLPLLMGLYLLLIRIFIQSWGLRIYLMLLLLFAEDFFFGGMSQAQFYLPQTFGMVVGMSVLALFLSDSLPLVIKEFVFIAAPFILIGARLPVAIGFFALFVFAPLLHRVIPFFSASFRQVATFFLCGAVGFYIFFVYNPNAILVFEPAIFQIKPFATFNRLLYVNDLQLSLTALANAFQLPNYQRIILFFLVGLPFIPLFLILHGTWFIPAAVCLFHSARKEPYFCNLVSMAILIVSSYLAFILIYHGGSDGYIIDLPFKLLMLLAVIYLERSRCLFWLKRSLFYLHFMVFVRSPLFPKRFLFRLWMVVFLITMLSSPFFSYLTDRGQYLSRRRIHDVFNSSRMYSVFVRRYSQFAEKVERMFFYPNSPPRMLGPHLYEAFFYIREYLPKDAVVVYSEALDSPGFFVTGFSERSAYLEDFPYRRRRYHTERQEHTLREFNQTKRLPVDWCDGRHYVLFPTSWVASIHLPSNTTSCVIYQNESWTVLRAFQASNLDQETSTLFTTKPEVN